MAFKLSKSQIQLKIKQSSSLELKSVHYWAQTSTKKKLPKESKLGHGNPGRKKSLKLLPQTDYLGKLVFSYRHLCELPTISRRSRERILDND